MDESMRQPTLAAVVFVRTAILGLLAGSGHPHRKRRTMERESEDSSS